MALTRDRPDYTAAQLNTAFINVRNALVSVLPDRILTVSGASNFIDLDIYDGGDIGGSVFTIEDSIQAVVTLANQREAGFFETGFDVDINAYIINVSGRIPAITLKNVNDNIAQRGGQFDDRSLRGRGITATSSSFVTNNTSDTNSGSFLSLYAKVYYFSSGTTSMGFSYEVNGGLSNAPSNALGGYEIYDNKGYEQWNLGVATTITLTAFSTIEMGYEQWNLGTATTLGNIEYFDCGWSEGIRPIVTGIVRIEENLTSQITGSATVFTTKRPYKSGTLQAIWNGQVQYEGTVSETSSTTFTTTFTAGVGDVLIITYEQADGGIERISLY